MPLNGEAFSLSRLLPRFDSTQKFQYSFFCASVEKHYFFGIEKSSLLHDDKSQETKDQVDQYEVILAQYWF